MLSLTEVLADDFNATVASHAGKSSQKIDNLHDNTRHCQILHTPRLALDTTFSG